MGISLMQLLAALEEEGVIGDEAEETVARFLENRKRSKGDALAKRERGPVAISNTPMDQEALVDYGDETPKEAEERWIEQERADTHQLENSGPVQRAEDYRGLAAQRVLAPCVGVRCVDEVDHGAVADADVA